MAAVRFLRTNGRLKKVSFTKLLRDDFGFPLDRAKDRTDALLDGETFVIEADTSEMANELVRKATELGAVCELVPDND